MLFIIFLNLVSILTRSFASVHDKDGAANVSLSRCSFQTLHESYIKMSKNFFYFAFVWECLEEFTNEAKCSLIERISYNPTSNEVNIFIRHRIIQTFDFL